MNKLIILLALLTIPLLAHAKQPIRSIDGTVIKVADGDTITVQDSLGTKVKVRLYGIDAPETEKSNKRTGRVSKPGQPHGQEAHAALAGKVDRQRVRLDVMNIDRYKRAVALVWLGGRNVNREMVSEGYAWAYRHYLDRAHASEYLGAEEAARRVRRGLWQEANPLPPWEFRKALRLR